MHLPLANLKFTHSRMVTMLISDQVPFFNILLISNQVLFFNVRLIYDEVWLSHPQLAL